MAVEQIAMSSEVPEETALTSVMRDAAPVLQIVGKRSGRLMLASNPASIMNHNPLPSGIPSDSVNQ
jgi:hypothetical protein